MWDVVVSLDLGLCESFYFLSDFVDASVVWGVELHDSLFESAAEDLSTEGKNWGGFASAWRAVEQKVGHFLSGFDAV